MKLRKFKKIGTTALALMTVMAMSGATGTTAFAWGNNGVGTANEEVVIGKSLKTPLNWSPENLTVTFNVSPVGFSTTKAGSTYQEVAGLTFDGTVTLTNSDFTETDEKDQVKYWGAESGNLVGKIKYTDEEGNNYTGLDALAAVAKDQNSTGAVKFTVTETGCTYTDDDNKTTLETSMASYDLEFWIDYKVVDGTPQYTVTSITDTKKKQDNGEDVSAKVDPTPGSTDVTETTYDDNGHIISKAGELSYDLSGMLFNNDITKSDEPDTPDTPTVDNNAFKLTKTNTDGDPSQEFTFNVTLKAPDLAGVDKNKQITVKVYDAQGLEVTDKATRFVYGQKNTISLKGGEKAVFGQMYNSTQVIVEEEGTPNYTPSYTSTYGSSTEQKNAGDSLSVTGVTKAKTDYVSYVNTYQSITPTGIIMNNLPFFMMIVIGAVAVVAGLVFQARRRVMRK